MIKRPRISFTMAFVALLQLTAFAQGEPSTVSVPDSKFSYGFRIGGVVSMFGYEQPHTGARLGYMVGGIATYRLSGQFSVQAEPSYLQQGGTLLQFTDNTRFGDTSPFSIYTTNANVTVHSIDIPVLAKYHLPALGNFQSNVVLGPAIGFTVGATETYERTYNYGQLYTTVTGKQAVTSQYEPYQFGATTGFGGEISLGGNLRLLMDLRYRYGITPIKKGFSYIDLNSVQGNLTTHSVYFTLGVGF